MSTHKKTVYQRLRDAFDSHPEMKTNILAEARGDRLYITFNRPKRYNAFSNDMFYYFNDLIRNAN